MAAGSVIIFASLLKTHQAVIDPVGVLEPFGFRPWLALFAIEGELLLGTWLFSGFRARAASWCASVLFAIFGAMSLAKIMAGAESCGCFGLVAIPPSYSFVLDAGLAIALCCFPPNANITALELKFPVALAVVAGCAGLAVGVIAERELVQRGIVINDPREANVGNVVLLEPQKWIGSPLPNRLRYSLKLCSSEGKKGGVSC